LLCIPFHAPPERLKRTQHCEGEYFAFVLIIG
jgi:hypothetical protein